MNRIVKYILKTINSAFEDSRVLFIARDSSSGSFKGRIGYGDNIDEMVSGFTFPISQDGNIFNLALRKNSAIRIRDIEDERIKSRIPPWYKEITSAKSFTLIPIVFNNTPFGLIYIENPTQQIRITDTQLNALKALGNQVILAIKAKR